MVHVVDSTQGRVVALPSRGQRMLRIRLHLACPGGAVGWDEVRVLVVADVLLRTLEMEGVQVFPALAVPDLPPSEMGRLDRLVAGYGVRVAGADDDPRADVRVLTSSGDVPAGSGVVLRVGPTTVTTARPPLPQEPTDFDASVSRCALLGGPWHKPLTLSEAVLLDAAAALAGWRTWLAAWSRYPSAPVPPAIRDEARTRLDAGLDTPGLLELLREAADEPGLPDGARFETFVWLDRVLGLELGRDLSAA